ncbi:hypothetical protein PN836_000310 [Ningiella sp. W23]|uniref:hypothetical protein n=1 Tax=Ningiella sp. W23 TaxID=3023715 RepID=UPI003757C3F4
MKISNIVLTAATVLALTATAYCFIGLFGASSAQSIELGKGAAEALSINAVGSDAGKSVIHPSYFYLGLLLVLAFALVWDDKDEIKAMRKRNKKR